MNNEIDVTTDEPETVSVGDALGECLGDALSRMLDEINRLTELEVQKLEQMEYELHNPTEGGFPFGDRFTQGMDELNELGRHSFQKINELSHLLGITDEEGNIKPEHQVTKQKYKPKIEDDGADLPYQEVLYNALCDGKQLSLRSGKLKRESYEKVRNALYLLGGRWVGGKTQAFVFDFEVAPVLENFLERGEVPDINPLSFFASKPAVCKKIAKWISPANAHLVLDADAGMGAIALAVKERHPEAEFHLVELDPRRAAILRDKNLGVVFEEDFLEFDSGSDYGAITINPPFSMEGDSLAYITHINKAWELLPGGGQLAAIAPLGFTFREDSRCKSFLEFVEGYGSYEVLPPGSFEGTGVAAALILIEKPADDDDSEEESRDWLSFPSFV
jgi:hypothetical protein